MAGAGGRNEGGVTSTVDHSSLLRRVRSVVSSASVSAEIDSIGKEIQAAAKSDDKMKVGAGD